jgi:hypothetical protein
MERYLAQVQDLSYKFISLLAEAFGLPPNGLAHFYDTDHLMQHRAKIVRYPTVDDSSSNQGVGPHYDAGFLTFVCTCYFQIIIPDIIPPHHSFYRHHYMKACKCKTYLENGLMCPLFQERLS